MKTKTDEAISNTIGFIIISGILLTSVATVFMIGLPVYNQYVDQSHLDNMIEGFDLISENGNNVALMKTPYQQSELKLYGGTITTADAGNMVMHFYSDTGGTAEIGFESVPLGIIQYSKGDTSIAYLLGGVFRKDVGDTSYPVVKNPPFYTYTSQYGTQLGIPAGKPVIAMPLITVTYSPTTLTGTTLCRISFSTFYRYQQEKADVSQPKMKTYTGVRHVKIILTSGEVNYNKALFTYFRDGFKYEKPADSCTLTTSTADSMEIDITYNSDAQTITTLPTQEIITINSGST